MKRGISLLLALTLIAALSATALAYDDTSALSSAEQTALTELSNRGVVNGYPDGTFRPAAEVNRAEFAKMLGVYAGLEELTSAVSPFSDVKNSAWYYGWVCLAKDKSWVKGYPEGDFRPLNPVTQQEIATVLVRLAGINTTNFSWPDDYIEAAQNAGAFRGLVSVGVAPASRIITCQMFYNMLPLLDKQDIVPEPTSKGLVRGIVTELDEGSIIVKDGKGVSTSYTISARLLPKNLMRGSYVELSVNDGAVARVAESIIPKKGVFVWDVALDGQSAVINNKKYDLSEAEIFSVEYTLNRPYSSETFISGGPIDRDMLSLGGRLAAEMAVLVETSGGNLITAYLVNTSIIVTGGRLDVVDGSLNSAKGPGLFFLGRDAGLPIDSSLATPAMGEFIHYTLKNGVINNWNTLLNIASGEAYSTEKLLKNAGENDPYAWVGPTGKPLTVLPYPADSDGTVPGDMNDVVSQVIRVGNGRNTLQLGANEHDCLNYWLAEGCLVYEVSPSSKISQGNRGSMEKGQDVIALINRNSEICYIFCFMD